MKTLEFRGINYDAGVIYEGSYNSRPVWRLDDVRRDLKVIRDELSMQRRLDHGHRHPAIG